MTLYFFPFFCFATTSARAAGRRSSDLLQTGEKGSLNKPVCQVQFDTREGEKERDRKRENVTERKKGGEKREKG